MKPPHRKPSAVSNRRRERVVALAQAGATTKEICAKLRLTRQLVEYYRDRAPETPARVLRTDKALALILEGATPKRAAKLAGLHLGSVYDVLARHRPVLAPRWITAREFDAILDQRRRIGLSDVPVNPPTPTSP